HRWLPADSPFTIRRWNSSTSTTRGSVTTTPAAICEPNGCWNSVSPANLASATVTGVEARVIETTLEIRYSFQAAKNTSREVVATPGAASGRITRAKAPTGPQPSTRAASSSSQGISRKKVVSTKIASGSAKLMLGT